MGRTLHRVPTNARLNAAHKLRGVNGAKRPSRRGNRSGMWERKRGAGKSAGEGAV